MGWQGFAQHGAPVFSGTTGDGSCGGTLGSGSKLKLSVGADTSRTCLTRM
jgi:hypothetical protein